MSAVRKILVPIKELSSRPIPAVLKAAQLARAHGAGLELFHSLRQPIVDLERGNPRRALPIAVPVRVESHHAHLTAVVIEQLFCDLYRLHPSGSVVQGGQYKTMEKVTLIGPEGRSREIPIVGPPSAANEIEISYTDALILGIRAPVRESGDLTGTPGVTLKGPRAQVALGNRRHLRHAPCTNEPWRGGKPGAQRSRSCECVRAERESKPVFPRCAGASRAGLQP
jgi:hypothetical protein